METFLAGLEFWHWLVLGIVLVIAEMFVFGAVLLWLGIAALLVGAIVFFLPSLGWMISLLVWAALSIILVTVFQAYRKNNPSKQADTTINRRGEQYVGRHFTLTKDIINGTGELNVDDTRWKTISHHDLTAGTKVQVIAVEGTSLRVEEYIS
jgi:membrane protein implicated in regulation of membrane protease activity